MKKLKQAICLALASCVFFIAGCSAATPGSGSSGTIPTSNSGQKGRYVETDITPDTPDGVSLLYSKNGSLVGFDSTFATRYESTDNGETWQTSPGPAQQNPDKAELFSSAYNAATLTPDGTLVIFISGQDIPSELWKISKDGTMEKMAVPELDRLVEEGQNPFVMLLKGLPGEKLLVSYSWGMGAPSEDMEEPASAPEGEAAEGEAEPESSSGMDTVFSHGGYGSKTLLLDIATGNTLLDLADMNGNSIDFNNDNFYITGYDGSIDVYSLSTNQKVNSITPEFVQGENDMFPLTAVDDAGNLYRLGNNSLQKANPEGKEVSTLFDTSSYSVSDPSSMAMSFTAAKDDSFFVSLFSPDAQKTSVYRYHYDKDAVLDPSKTLNIWSLDESSLVRAAITQYRKSNPDVQVNYEVALAQGGQTAEDAVRNLNTRLLAGDGPDILILDGTSAENYIKKGMLKDLSNVVDAGTLYENLGSVFKNEKGNFVLPARFTLPVLLGQSANLAQTSSFEDFTKFATSGPDYAKPSSDSDGFSALPAEQQPNLLFGNLDELFNLLWQTSASEVVKDNKLDSQALRQFLETAKALAEKNNFTKPDSQNELGGMAFSFGSGSMTTIEGSSMAYLNSQAKTGALSVQDMMALWYALGASTIQGTEISPSPGMVENAWIPSTLTGINASTKVPELAEDFVKNMFSPAVQGASVGGGLPVTPEGAKTVLNTINKMMEESGNPTLEFDFDKTVSQFKNPVLIDTTLAEKFEETTQEFCFGNLSLDEAAGKIEQDVRNYLAERQ